MPIEAADRLVRNIHAPQQRMYWMQPKPGEFEGWVSEGRFRVKRGIRYRNSGTPLAYGRIEPSPSGGSRIRIRMTFHPMVWSFAAIWIGFAITDLIYSRRHVIEGVSLANGVWSAVGMVAFLWLGLIVGWLLEAGKSASEKVSAGRLRYEV